MRKVPDFRLREETAAVFLALLLATAPGCGRDDVRAYSAPKDSPAGAPPSSPRGTATAPAAAQAFPTWQLPPGWREEPGSGMRFATIFMGEAEDAPEIRVTPLASMAGDRLANVNRWLSQLGQPPIGAGGLGQVMKSVEVGDVAVDLVHLEGPEAGDETQQILAAILPYGDSVWFLMTMGTREDLAPRTDAFDTFVGTLKMHGMAAPPPASSPVPVNPGATPPAGDGLAWTLPPGWVEVQNTGSMRLATFRAGSGDASAEVTITRFPGDVGGTLANINRWRGQLGLPAVATPSEQPGRELKVAGSPATTYDIQGSSSRMLVTSVARGGQTWFVKMTGSIALLAKEKAHFELFVDSVQLPGAP